MNMMTTISTVTASPAPELSQGMVGRTLTSSHATSCSAFEVRLSSRSASIHLG